MTAINFQDPGVRATLAELQPLAAIIADTLHTVPVRIGPGGDEDLVAELTLGVAIFCARHVLPTEAAELARPPHEPSRTWVLERQSRGHWYSSGAALLTRSEGLHEYTETLGYRGGTEHALRLVRATTTYAVEAEHIPAEAGHDSEESDRA